MITSENLLSSLDQFNTAIYLKDLQGRYLSMNRSGILMMRKSIDAVLGKTAFDLFDTQSALEMTESDHVLLRSKNVQARSFNSHDRSSGLPMDIFTAKVPILSPTGCALGVLGLSIVNSKNSALFADTCQLLPQFIKRKTPHLVSELLAVRTLNDFFKVHFFQ